MAPSERTDGWQNVITGLGVAARDKRLASQIASPARLSDQELTDLYAGDPIAARICDLPAREMTRRWITIGAEDDPELGKEVLQELEVLGAQEQICDALVWGRLYGGAIVIIGADDGQDPRLPLELDRVRSIEYLTVVDRSSLEVMQRYSSLRNFGQPEIYRIATGSLVSAGGSPLGREVHDSRVLRFDGVRTPRWRVDRNDGWTDSIFVKLLGAVRDFWGGYDGAASLLQDFAQGVFKIANLAELVGSGQDEVVLKRLQAVDLLRSILRAVVIDKDEEFARQQTPVAGMPELLDRMQQLLAAVTDIPVTLLMGRSPAGLNATGDADIRFFYDFIAAQQQTVLRPRLEKLLTILLRAKKGPTGGIEPAGWSFDFPPLWQLTDKERAEVRKIHAEADSLDIASGVLHPEEARRSHYAGDRYSPEIILDPEYDDPATREAAPPPELDPAIGDPQPGADNGGTED